MLKHRLISGVSIVSAMLFGIFFAPAHVVWLVLVVMSSLALWEFYQFADRADLPVFRYYGLVAGVALISATYLNIGPQPEDMLRAYRWEMAILFLTVLTIFVRQFPQKYNDRPIETVACTLLGILYVPVLFNFITRLLFAWDGVAGGGPLQQTGRSLLLYLVLVVKITDIGAYFTGRACGKHKLFPRLSPAKTWEGLSGGVTTAVLASMLYCLLSGGRLGALEFSFVDAAIMGVTLALVGAIGDLFESLLKRASGAKDSGQTIPGMGGVLDVLDSILFAAPALYAYAQFFLQVAP